MVRSLPVIGEVLRVRILVVQPVPHFLDMPSLVGLGVELVVQPVPHVVRIPSGGIGKGLYLRLERPASQGARCDAEDGLVPRTPDPESDGVARWPARGYGRDGRDVWRRQERNKHASKREKLGRGPVGKQAVLGMKERGGRVVAFPVARTDKVELQSAVIENVVPGSNLFTDGNSSYQSYPDTCTTW